MNFICLVFFTCVYKIKSENPIQTFPSYGLIQGAMFKMSIQSKKNNFFVGLLNSDENSKIPQLSIPFVSQFCRDSKDTNYFSMINYSFFSKIYEPSFQITIPRLDVYNLIIVNCFMNESIYSVNIKYKNGNNLLDLRWFPSFIIIPISFFTILVLTIFWILNLLLHKNRTTSLHIYITVSLILSLLKGGLDYADLSYKKKSDNPTQLSVFKGLINGICSISIFSMSILAGKGWCIGVPFFSISDIIEVVSFCLIYQLLIVLFEQIQILVFQVVIFVFIVSLLSVIWISLFSKIKILQKELISHLYVIYKSDINPISTPIYRKYFIFTLLSYVIVFYFSCNIVILSLGFLDTISFWKKDLFFWILNGGLLVSITFLFTLRKSDIYEIDTVNEGIQMSNDEIMNMNLDFLSDKDIQLLKKWDESIKLPPPPLILVNEEDVPSFNEDLTSLEI